MAQGNSAKEDMPSHRQYLALKRAAKDEVKETFQRECLFVLRVIGELGLRAGEVAHIEEEWVDFDEFKLSIPSFERCYNGKDGGPCGYCKKRAKEEADADDNLTYETALRDRWKPTNEESIRTLWFGWDNSLIELIDGYLYDHGSYGGSRVSVNRRVNRIVESCERVDDEDIYPESLRAHAAKYQAKEGMSAFHLKEFMGWSDIEAAIPYIERTSEGIESELKRIHRNSHTLK